VRETIIRLAIEGVLTEVRVLRGLETVVLVEELEMESALVGHIGIVGIEGHLRASGCGARESAEKKGELQQRAHVEDSPHFNGTSRRIRMNGV
jgi:hypothetical protein